MKTNDPSPCHMKNCVIEVLGDVLKSLACSFIVKSSPSKVKYCKKIIC